MSNSSGRSESCSSWRLLAFLSKHPCVPTPFSLDLDSLVGRVSCRRSLEVKLTRIHISVSLVNPVPGGGSE